MARIDHFLEPKTYTAFLVITYEFLLLAQTMGLIFDKFGMETVKLIGCNNVTFESWLKSLNKTPVARKASGIWDWKWPDNCTWYNQAREVDASVEPNVSVQFFSAVREFEWWCSFEVYDRLYKVAPIIGYLIGCVVFSYVSDAIGRHKTLYIGTTGLAVSSLFSTFSLEINSFVFTRAIVMMFTACVYVTTVAFMVDCLPTKHRLLLMTLVTHSANYPVVAFLAYLVGEWRWLTRIGATLALLPIPFLKFTYESPRWLLQAKKFERFEIAILGIGKWDRTNTTEKKEILFDMVDRERARQRRLESVTKTTKYTFKDLFARRQFSNQLSALAYSYFMSSVIFYGLTYRGDLVHSSIYSNVAIIGAARYAVSAFCAVLEFRIKAVGRRVLHGLCLIFMTSGCVTIFALNLTGGVDEETGTTVVTYMTLLVAAFCSELFIVLNVSVGELAPTPMRTMAVGFAVGCGFTGSLMGPLFMVVAYRWPPLPCLVMTILCVVDFAFLFITTPETKGHPLIERTNLKLVDEADLPPETKSTQPSHTEDLHGGKKANARNKGKVKKKDPKAAVTDVQKRGAHADAKKSSTSDAAAAPAAVASPKEASDETQPSQSSMLSSQQTQATLYEQDSQPANHIVATTPRSAELLTSSTTAASILPRSSTNDVPTTPPGNLPAMSESYHPSAAPPSNLPNAPESNLPTTSPAILPSMSAAPTGNQPSTP